MSTYEHTCPLSQQRLIEEYFMEIRAKILDIAAFLDRMDRSSDGNAEDDFRMVAMWQALQALDKHTSNRAFAIQMIFSDPTTELRERLDRKSAFGAFDSNQGEVK